MSLNSFQVKDMENTNVVKADGPSVLNMSHQPYSDNTPTSHNDNDYNGPLLREPTELEVRISDISLICLRGFFVK